MSGSAGWSVVRGRERAMTKLPTSGPWADHFSIIAWPITHAILPRYLQLQFAKALYDARLEFARLPNPTPAAAGQLLGSGPMWVATPSSQWTHMGVFGSSGQAHRHIKKLRWLFRYPRSEPYFMTWLVPHQIKLTSGRRSKQLHQYPAFGGWGSGGRDHSFTRLFKPVHCSVPIAWIRQDRLGPEDWKDCVGASALRWSSSRRPR